jgi:ribosomal protein S18 acetylase RimI-like enzyme
MIRNRTPSDDGAIFLLVNNELVPFARRTFPNIKPNLKEIVTRLNRGTTYVADAGGKPEGFIHWLVKEKDLWIDMLAVSPQSRGRGWGTALMNQVEWEGMNRGCWKANLFVDVINDRAQRFYASRGYGFERYVAEVNCYHFSKLLDGRPNRLYSPAIG